MNIKNFLSSIYSSTIKKKQPQKDESCNSILSSKSCQINQDEDLLSNLRKSKIFLDDSGLQSIIPSLQSIQEDNSQAFQNAERVVGLMNSSKKKNSKAFQPLPNKNPEFLELVAKAKQELSSQRQSNQNNHNRFLFEVNDIHTQNKNELPNNLFASQNSIFDTKNDQRQNQVNVFKQNNNGLSAQNISNSRMFNEIDQSEFQKKQSFQQNQYLQQEVESSQNHLNHQSQKNSERNSLVNYNKQPNQQLLPSQRSSSYNARIRGSSSKKKNVLFESPISGKKKRERSDEKYPSLEQLRESIHVVNSYHPQVNEDVEGENEGQVQQILYESIYNMKELQNNNQEKMHISNLSEFTSLNKQLLNSSQKQYECHSNKAEPATNVKQRSNSLFEQSLQKKKFFDLDEICSKTSNLSPSSIYINQNNHNIMNNDTNISNMQSKQMEPDFQNSLMSYQEPNQITMAQSIHMKDDSKNQNKENINNQNIINYFNNQNNNENKKYSFQNIKQSIQSPKKSSLNFTQENKQINLKIDIYDKKSNEYSLNNSNKQLLFKYIIQNIINILSIYLNNQIIIIPQYPRIQLKFNQFSISFIFYQITFNHFILLIQQKLILKKYTIQFLYIFLTQNNIILKCKRIIVNQIDLNENSNYNYENLVDGESPKMRQKSVKFENNLFTPYQNQLSDEEFRLNQKLQSRKPTPYNYEKHNPKSQIIRQNKFANEDSKQDSQNKQLDSNGCSQSTKSDIFKENFSISLQKEQNDTQEADKKDLPIFKGMDNKNNNFFQKPRTASSNNQTSNANNQNQKNIAKKPQVFKRKDELNQIQSNNFFKAENNNSTPLLINSNNNSSSQSNNIFEKPIQNFKKRKPLTEEQAILSNFVSSQRIKTHDESSLPLPSQSSQMRGTMLSGSIPLVFKSVFKTCIYCQNEIKLKEEVKSFACCHKVHQKCLPKDKNPKCMRCNPNKK